MSIATEITRLQTAKANLKTSLEAKGATIASDATIDTYPTVLDDIPVCTLQDKQVTVSAGSTTTISPDNGYTGLHEVEVSVQASLEPKTVNFYDFDGTLVTAYTAEEAQSLTELPSEPDHSQDLVPLTPDGWNWTLQGIKEYLTNNPEADINVGALYDTVDHKTHMIYDIDAPNTSIKLKITGGSFSIDWGDGSEIESYSYSAGQGKEFTHIYQLVGVYDCKLDYSYTETARYVYFGTQTGDSSYGFDYRFGKNLKHLRLGSNLILEWSDKKIHISNCINLEDISFTSDSSNRISINGLIKIKCMNLNLSVIDIGYNGGGFPNLEVLTIPKSITSLSSFYPRYSKIKSFTFPEGVSTSGSNLNNLSKVVIPTLSTGIGSFSDCASLREFIIPEGITTIPTYCLLSDYYVYNLELPSTITTINEAPFSSVQYLTVKSTTPPTLSSSSGLYNAIKIYVPYSSDHSILTAYQSATNWAAYASIMEELPAS